MVAVAPEMTVGRNLLINRFANIDVPILSREIQVCLRHVAAKIVIQEECTTGGSPADANVSLDLKQQFAGLGSVIDQPKFSISVFAVMVDTIPTFQSKSAIGRNASFGEGKVRKSALAGALYRSQQ
jgi:hypothetical protein